MRGRWLLAAVALGASACSLVVGTSEYTLGDAGGPGDSSADDVQSGADAADVVTTDVVENDAEVPDASTCSSLGCLAAAGVCGSSCGVTYASCTNACKNNPGCLSKCSSDNATCRAACSAVCFACTVDAGCADQTGCDDASAK